MTRKRITPAPAQGGAAHRPSARRASRIGAASLLMLLSQTLAHALVRTAPGDAFGEPSGGETTVVDTSRNAFSNPAANLKGDRLTPFFVGNSFFKRNWVEAPASTGARDGLGPLFHARSCSGCHVLDGRAVLPSAAGSQEAAPGLLIRLSIPGQDAHGGPLPEPSYGRQFAPQATQGVKAEGNVVLQYKARTAAYADGQRYTLRVPQYRLTALAYGPLAKDTLLSPRLAPQVIGMGLLEAIAEADLLQTAERQRLAGTAVRGRVNRVWDAYAQKEVVGRFGWKANVGSIAHQTAAAFADDIGITSKRFPAEDCTTVQTACASAPRGGATGRAGQAAAGQPEIDEHTLEQVIYYARTLAVPAQRDANHAQVLRGQALFERAACSACHVPAQRTGVLDGFPELSKQRIRPYTDLLLHDMGAELADGRPDFLAGPRDWRTPPLWGLGLIDTVNGSANFLHDGRARNIEEAILWHGGEAAESRGAFVQLSAKDRAALLRFVKSL